MPAFTIISGSLESSISLRKLDTFCCTLGVFGKQFHASLMPDNRRIAVPIRKPNRLRQSVQLASASTDFRAYAKPRLKSFAKTPAAAWERTAESLGCAAAACSQCFPYSFMNVGDGCQ